MELMLTYTGALGLRLRDIEKGTPVATVFLRTLFSIRLST